MKSLSFARKRIRIPLEDFACHAPEHRRADNLIGVCVRRRLDGGARVPDGSLPERPSSGVCRISTLGRDRLCFGQPDGRNGVSDLAPA